MSDSWYIYKDGQSIGPLTAAAIRDALRDGTFDPFDLVSREGSSVRRELVEVDEIFFSSKVVYSEGAAPNASLGTSSGNANVAAAADGRGGFIPSSDGAQSTRANARNAEMGIGQGHLALADSKASNRPPQSRTGSSKRKKGAKRYQLIDAKGRVVGPVSASEVQSLYYKGVLDKSVHVVRTGSTARVPVAKFVSVFADNAGPGRGLAGGNPQVKPAGQNTLLKIAVARQQRILDQKDTMTIVIILLGVALIFSAVFVAYRNGVFDSKPDRPKHHDVRPTKPKPRPLPKDVGNEGLRPKQKPWVKPTKPKRKPAAIRKPVRGETREARRARVLAERKKAREEAQRKRREKAVEARRKQLEEERQRRQRVARPTAPLPRPPAPTPKPPPKAQPVAQPKPPPQPVAQPAPAPAPQPKPSGGGVKSLVNGQTVNGLGPMTYDKTEIEICEGSCSVTFVGAGGAVQVTFFKDAYGPALMQKNGSAYISGLVRKKGKSVKIILSGVK